MNGNRQKEGGQKGGTRGDAVSRGEEIEPLETSRQGEKEPGSTVQRKELKTSRREHPRSHSQFHPRNFRGGKKKVKAGNGITRRRGPWVRAVSQNSSRLPLKKRKKRKESGVKGKCQRKGGETAGREAIFLLKVWDKHPPRLQPTHPRPWEGAKKRIAKGSELVRDLGYEREKETQKICGQFVQGQPFPAPGTVC